MKHPLLIIIAVLAAIILALFSLDTANNQYSTRSYRTYSYNPAPNAWNGAGDGTLSVLQKDNTGSTVALLKEGVEAEEDCPLPITHSELNTPPAILATSAMTELTPVQLPPLDAGMVNVTGGFDGNSQTAGYRVNPRPGEFAIAVPYDPSLLPQGFTEDDIQTYVYDRQYHRWIAIQRDSVNEAEMLVCSRFRPWEKGLPHTQNDLANPQDALAQVQDMMLFAPQGEGGGDSPLDFINAVLKTPEMPETSAYTPTSIKELKAADPLEGLTLMQPPTANNSGTANLSYPIEIPAGRQGMQPNLALTYNSGSGNGWLGVGWDISIPSITVETRWGVPRYSNNWESEVYVYEGEQLVTKDGAGEFRKMAHRTNDTSSIYRLSGNVQYFPRKNEVFDSIVRHGNGPGNYWWSVTHRNGVTDYYGKYASDNGVNDSCVLRKTDDDNTNSIGPIAHWALAESVDPDGNSVRYYYDIVYSRGVSNGSWGKQIYADSISYTCVTNTSPVLEELGKYSVVFQRKGTNRTDIITSLNRGLKEVTADVLCHLDVKYRDTLFRQYFFVTKNDKTTKYKTIVTDIVRIDSPAVQKNCDNVLERDELIWSGMVQGNKNKSYSARYHLDYFEYPSAGNLYSSPNTVNGLPNDDISLKGVKNTFRSTALGATKTKSWNLGGTGAVGLGPDVCTTIATFGANATYSNSKSEGLMTLVDLDGDGLADKVFKKDGKLYFRKRLYSPEVPFAFETTRHQITGGVGDFLKESSNGISIGLQASCVLEVSNGLPVDWSTTTNYMTDVNGDGLVDIVTDGGAYFGKHIQGQTPSFSPINAIQTTIPESGDTNFSYISSSLLGTGNCGGIIFDGEVDPDIACVLHSYERAIPRSDTIPDEFLNDGCITQIVGYKNYEYVEPHIVDTIHTQPKKSGTHVWPHAVDSMIIRTVCPDEKDCRPKQYAPDFDAVRVWVAPYNDTIKIISSIRLTPNDTTLFRQSRYADGVYCSIEHNEGCHTSTDGKKLVSTNQPYLLLFQDVVRPDSNFVDTIRNIIVSKDDILFFRLQSKDNRSFDKVDWRVRIEAKGHAGLGIDTYGRDAAVFNSDSDFVLTGKNLFQTPLSGHIWLSGRLRHKDAGASGRIMLVTPDTSVCLYTLNSNLTKDTMLCVGPIHVDTPNTITVRIERTNTDNLQWPNIHFSPLLKFYPANDSLIKDTIYYYPQIQMDIKHDDSTEPFKTLCRKYFGELYRGWGQFAYNRKGSNTSLIELSSLELPIWYTATSLSSSEESVLHTIVDTNDLDNSLSAAVGSVNNPLVSVIDDSASVVSWVEMTAYNDIGMYRGTGLNTAVSASFLDNTEPVLNIPVADSVPGSLSYGESDVDLESIPVYDHPVPVSVNGEPVQTIRKRHWNIGGNESVGVNAVLLSFGRSGSIGGAYIESDYMDMNGDRYPDPVSTGGVQYSMPWGGIGNLKAIVLPKNDHLSASESYSHGQTHGRCYPDPRKLPSNNPKYGKTALTGSGTLSESEVINEDITDYMLMDVNGDGLPDIVDPSNKAVRLNTGYDFLRAESWNVDFVREGESRNQSTNIGLSGGWENPDLQSVPANSYSLAQVSISGGTGKGTSYNITAKQMMDVNGDGLPDKVEAISNGIRVCYNLGNGQWSPVDTISGVSISASRSSSEDVNFGVTAGFTVCAIAKVNVGIQTSPYNRSFATDVAQLVDIDGDGYPDYITSGNERSVTIRFNTAGKTNLLRKVTNFTGSTIEMDYDLSIPSYEKPQRSWNLSRVETNNNVPNCPVGGNRTLTTFSYGNPHYDRYERMEFGYDTVKVIVHNTDSSDAPYRQNITVYNNVNLAKRGRKVMEAVLDGNGTKYVVKLYESLLKDFLGNTVSDDTCCIEGIYVGHVVETTTYYEGMDNDSIVVAVSKIYDRYRNITRYAYEGIVGNGNAQKFTARIAYKQNAGHNMVSLPETVVVFNHDSSEIFQSRTAEYDSKGHLTRLTRHNGAQDAVWDLSYDNYGNMVWAKLPANANSQRLEFTYGYDPVVHTYPVAVTNSSLGFSSSAEYEYLYGKPTKTTDINGNEMWYKYDPAGRTVQITAPYEQGTAPYTIRMDYSPHNYSDIDIFHNWLNPYSSAITRHYDPEHPDNDIVTTIISDGWGRMLQTKKDAEIGGQEKSIVTGKVEYDCFGRTVAQYHPFTEVADSLTRPLYNPQIEIGTATVTRYDIMDRPVRVQDPMSHVTRMSRGFSSDSSRRYFSDTIIDAKNNKVVLLKDGLGLQILQVAPMNTTTRFKYDAIGQLKKSTDPDGFDTEYWYDKFGRLTHRHHPDAGDDWYEYDPAGNLTRHTNAAGEHLDYTYHYNQLTDIACSVYPESNVHYEYGTTANASINAVGKVILQDDASGWQTFSYGKLGELTENIRTFAPPFENQAYTFNMYFEYDSWNRIQIITYPDGEKVSYDYNRGGMLESVNGDKNGDTYKYIEEIRYNPFEQKESVHYGNGTVTDYSYDVLLRLSHLRSVCADGTMQDIDYDYDSVSNINFIENHAGALPSGLGGTYRSDYSYDNLYRLISANGEWHGNKDLYYETFSDYEMNGRISRKTLIANTWMNGNYSTEDYDNEYHYANSSQPNTLTDIVGDAQQSFEWDLKGNMVFHHNEKAGYDRRMCWDEQNCLLGVKDEGMHLSYYQYDANGDRTYKFTGEYAAQNQSGQWHYYYLLNCPTLYASPYLVTNKKGYTKHYYAENERIASRIGGGGLQELDKGTVNEPGLFDEHRERANALLERTAACLEASVLPVWDVLSYLYEWREIREEEKDCYWYHPDHLGSSSWITFSDGSAVQHLHYFPWGEDFVDQRSTSWNAMYTFSAKERDAETGLSYFGSRYYSSDLSVWLSVDPMSDKYPSLSPYTYCADNPVKLVDPNGEDITSPDGWIVDNTNKTLTWVNDNGGDMIQYVGCAVASFQSRNDFMNDYASKGYKIILESYPQPVLNVGSSSTQVPPALSTNDYSKSFLGAVSDAYSGSARGWNSLSNSQQQKLSYNLTKSLKNNGYSIQTRQVKGGIKSFYSTNVTRGMYAFNTTMDIADFAYSYKVLDGGRFGVNSSSSLGSSVGGWGGRFIRYEIRSHFGSTFRSIWLPCWWIHWWSCFWLLGI